MTEHKQLKGKVAAILNEYSIAINIGKNDGVKQGMVFAVVGNRPIVDPDSAKILGQYEYDKVKVTVSKVDDKYSVAETIASVYRGFPTLNLGFETETRPKVISEETKLGVSRTVSIGDVAEERK
jgi:hypothetical protein